jgi:hypothetical protein
MANYLNNRVVGSGMVMKMRGYVITDETGSVFISSVTSSMISQSLTDWIILLTVALLTVWLLNWPRIYHHSLVEHIGGSGLMRPIR